MSKLVTIRAFIHLYELDMARTYLESHGIDCFVKDELTVQTYHWYSNAIGGIKLQVNEEDAQRAIALLISAGYLNQKDIEPVQAESKWRQFASNVPLIGKWRPEYRISFLIGSFVVVLMTVVYFAFFYGNVPITEADFTSGYWCVRQVEYRDKAYTPNTKTEEVAEIDSPNQVYIRIGELTNCDEYAKFDNEHVLRLPGIGTRPVFAKWYIKEDRLIIDHADTLRLVYNGLYEMERRSNTITLTSGSTIIHLVEDDFISRFDPRF